MASQRGFIDREIRHLNEIMPGMANRGGIDMLDQQRRSIEEVHRWKPKDGIEEVISDGVHRLIRPTQQFVNRLKAPFDPLQMRKERLIPVAKLEHAMTQFPNIRDVGSFQSGLIQNYIQERAAENRAIEDQNLRVLGEAVLDANIFA
ncbi:MAG: hypothetical protein ACR2ON_03265 [Paracoccaceae bacterium]